MEFDKTGGVLNYHIDNTFNNYNKKFNCTTSTYNSKTFSEAHSDIENAFKALHDRPISLPFMSKTQLTPAGLLENFEHVAQSYKSVKLNENNNLTASVVIAHLPIGSGHVNFSAFQEFCNKKPGIKTVFNHDNRCALRAILIAKAYSDKDPYRFELCKANNPVLNAKVEFVASSLNLPNSAYGIEEIKLIENYLKNYQITGINCDGKLDKTPIYI
ncbi:unnamed protein product [Brachionus calyciflorus]|uniref:Uncharacterized protein n=1 Tax=Brachionus calyciflorus TaxID=104777 RepID=A0A814S0C0_9BILA|nr:unnamed protein product [Brachionus calyciflorus]